MSASKVVGKFGLAYSLARLTMGGMGLKVSTSELNFGKNKTETYFAENLYQVVVSLPKEKANEVMSKSYGFKVFNLGTSGGHQLKIDDEIEVSVEELQSSYYKSWRNHFESLA